jgi:hypothetical protein
LLGKWSDNGVIASVRSSGLDVGLVPYGWLWVVVVCSPGKTRKRMADDDDDAYFNEEDDDEATAMVVDDGESWGPPARHEPQAMSHKRRTSLPPLNLRSAFISHHLGA